MVRDSCVAEPGQLLWGQEGTGPASGARAVGGTELNIGLQPSLRSAVAQRQAAHTFSLFIARSDRTP